jgi:hypothetical protein
MDQLMIIWTRRTEREEREHLDDYKHQVREAETWVISDTLDLSAFSTWIFEVINGKLTARGR